MRKRTVLPDYQPGAISRYATSPQNSDKSTDLLQKEKATKVIRRSAFSLNVRSLHTRISRNV